jgi:signal transduction histidine kinase/ligand-binding sensor domain-containing protein/AraC-like DNA-binding protein
VKPGLKYIICIGLYLALHPVILAQKSDLRFKHLSVQDGLSRSWVKCFLEDRTGLLWIGTSDGLNKYDGQSFKIYKYLPSQSRSLNHNDTNVIFEDSNGYLWVGTQAGLNYYQRESDEFIPVPFVNTYVTSLYELRKENLLVGTAGGLCIFNTVSHTSKRLFDDLYVEKILKDSRGNIWLATHTGLLLFNPVDNTVRSIKSGSSQKDALNNALLKIIFQDSREGIWIGTASHGLYYLTYPTDHPDEARFINFKSDPTDSEHITEGAIYAIAEDEDSNLWVGIENGGINMLSLEEFDKGDYLFTKIVNNPSDFSSLSNNSIHALYTDKQNSMWVGTYAGGADYYNKLLQRFGHQEAIPGSNKSINNKYVSAILDEDKYLWVGAEKGLNRYNKATGNWEYFTHDFKDPTTIGSNTVLAIMRDSQSRLWVGTWNGGLNLFDEKSKSFLKFRHDPKNPASISGDNSYQIIESGNHHIWIGLMGSGVVDYNPEEGSFTSFQENPNKKNALSSDWVNDLIEDHLGNIWISTTEAVDRLNPTSGQFTTFTHDPIKAKSISYNGATCLFEDSRNTMWIGTSNGLNYFVEKDSSFHHYTVEDGLPNNFIKAITEDHNGNIWFSTNNTLTMFKKGTALPEHPEFRSFSVFDGLPSGEFVSHAVFHSSKGELYFGSTNGYFVFDPSGIINNPTIPKIVFTDLRVNNMAVSINTPGSPLEKDISVTTQLKLSRKQNVFSIGFAALNFIEPENNRYAFKLEGFDKQWNYVSNQQSATYTNLDPGNYTFRVRASNNDGLWNEEGVSMKIIISPAWWQTWFARMVYLLLFTIGIFFFRKHTIISVNLKNVLWREHLEKQKFEELTQMKQQFFANVSHELRTPLTLILGPLSRLVKENMIPELDAIFRNSTRLKILVDQFLDFGKMDSNMMMVSPTRTEVLELTRYLMANFSDFAGQKNIELKLEAKFSKCVAMIDQDKYEKILTNLLSNAMKSITGKGSVAAQLAFDLESSKLLIKVIDTGRGITPEESEHIFERYYSGSNHIKNMNGTGIGLYLTRELIELHKGTIGVTSTVGKGSTFTISLPITVLEFEKGNDDILFDTQPLADKVINSPEYSSQSFERTILIVDDNEAICDYVETILCDEFNVIKENNPLTCIDKIIKYMPDLIISDVMMPEMDGFQLCRLIKEDVRFSHIPVILLTAKATKHDHIIGYETGADDYVYKPFDEEILKARVKNLVTRIEKLKKHFIGHDGIINPSVQTNALDVKFMEEVLAEVKKNYLNPQFNVNQIVDKIGMSRSLFYKKFKSLSEYSIHDLIKNFRLKKAAMLLADGHLTVSQVAYDCGFTDPAYFSRVFKEYYSIAPKDFSSSTHSKVD